MTNPDPQQRVDPRALELIRELRDAVRAEPLRSSRMHDAIARADGFTNITGKTGMLPQFCTGEWKRDAVRRYLRSRGVKRANIWIGFSLNEMSRATKMAASVKGSPKWLLPVFPLIELGMRREACVRAIADAGWPPSPRSACWMCSHQADREWEALRRDTPGDFEKAVTLEREVRARSALFPARDVLATGPSDIRGSATGQPF